MVTQIPLFPLNTVLFPGTPMRLHIFEPRYQSMVRRCMDEQLPFGVVLIRHGQEALGPLAEPYEVGTSAEIVQTRHLEDGRMNLVVVGQERFRIRTLDAQTTPYLTGEVEAFPLETGQPEVIANQSQELRSKVQRYLARLMKSGIGQYDVEQLPSDPVELAWLAAALIQVEITEKQAWLETRRGEEFLPILVNAYRRELALVHSLLESHEDQGGMFSAN